MHERLSAPIARTPGSPSLVVLNVDDNEAGRYALSRLLQQAGFTVVEAAGGHEALRRVATTLPALVLLDVHLPDMSGMDVCRQLKANPSTAAIPVLQRSAVFTRSSDKVHGLEGGADGYLVEPVEPVELVATIKALLRTQRVEELHQTLEELHVHEEELRQQNDELAGARETIEAERQRYLELFEYAPDGYVVTDAHGVIEAVNRAAAAGLNRLGEHLVGKPLSACVVEGHRSAFLTLLDRIWHGEDVGEPEVPLQPVGRAPFVAALRVAVLRDPQGRVTGLRWLLRDITERKQAEAALRQARAELEQRVHERTAALRESEARFRAAQEASLDAFTILRSVRDAQGRIVDFVWEYVNQRAASLLRRPSAALVGQRLLQVLPETETRSQLFEDYVRVAETGESCDHELSYGADGITGWFRTLIVKLDDGVANTFSDITARKQAEEASLRLAAIVASSDDAILSKSLDGIITSWNAAAERIFGYRAEEMVGQPMRRLLPEDRQDEEDLILARLRRGERINHFETVRRDKAGRLLEMSIMISPLRDAQGRIIGASTVARDITVRKQAEDERTRLLAELQQFAYIISHDLTEPLRTIRSYVELLAQRLQGELDPTADQYMAFVTDAVQRLQQLLTALLAYTRIGGSAAQSTAVDCEAVLAEVLSDLQLAIRESGAKVTHDELPTVYADAGQVGLVFQNLIGNAMKFRGPAPPRIHLSSRREGAQWVVAVQDNGIGIDSKHAERIFQVFQRLHTRSEYSGTGMGLAICRKIIERHEGRIWAESRPGQGATFFFTLPAYAPSPRQTNSRKDGDSK